MFSRSLCAVIAIFVIFSATVLSQTPPEFEVASIRPANLQGYQTNIGMHIDGAQVRFTLFNLTALIGYAYEIPPYQVDGPDWMGSAFFDIAAKMPDEARATQARAMLRKLLARSCRCGHCRERSGLLWTGRSSI